MNSIQMQAFADEMEKIALTAPGFLSKPIAATKRFFGKLNPNSIAKTKQVQPQPTANFRQARNKPRGANNHLRTFLNDGATMYALDDSYGMLRNVDWSDIGDWLD